jgi:hypothetical protein
MTTKNIINNNQIRNRLKIPVPLLKLNKCEIEKEISQNNEKHLLTNIVQNGLVHNEDIIMYHNTFLDDDFTDTEGEYIFISLLKNYYFILHFNCD